VFEQYAGYAELVDIDLASEVPQDLAGLIVTQPARPLKESELRHIDAFLMRGSKGVAFYVSPVDVPVGDPSMKGSIVKHGIEPLLLAYGVAQRSEVVFDNGSPLSFASIDEDGKQVALSHSPTPYVSKERLDTASALFFGMEGIPFPFAAPLEIKKDKQPLPVARCWHAARKRPRLKLARRSSSAPSARARSKARLASSPSR